MHLDDRFNPDVDEWSRSMFVRGYRRPSLPWQLLWALLLLVVCIAMVGAVLLWGGIY